MASGEGVIRRFITGRSWKKCAVLPVSAMTLVEELECNEVGGPKEGGGSYKIDGTSLHAGSEASEVQLVSIVDELFSSGFPRYHELIRGWRGRLMILLLPPIMFEIVAPVL
jgi:hypothetical protein